MDLVKIFRSLGRLVAKPPSGSGVVARLLQIAEHD
jgi:hypothetical protein